MPMPRKPKGEKSAVTTRWQRRQMNLMEQTIAGLRSTVANVKEQRNLAQNQLDAALRELQTVRNDIIGCTELARIATEKATEAERQLSYFKGFYDGTQTGRRPLSSD